MATPRLGFWAALGLVFFMAPRAGAVPTFHVGEATAAPGQEDVAIPLRLSYGSGPVYRWSATVRYDPRVLCRVSIESAFPTVVSSFAGPEHFVVPGRAHIYVVLESPSAVSGEIVGWLRFCVARDAAPGEYVVDMIRRADMVDPESGTPPQFLGLGGDTTCETSTAYVWAEATPGKLLVAGEPLPGSTCEPDSHLEDLVFLPPYCPPAGPPAPESRFEVESVTGAVGDVVPVTVSLYSRISEIESFELNLCHDPAVAEPVGEPIYSEELMALVDISGMFFASVDEDAELSPFDPEASHTGHGTHLWFSVKRPAWRERFPSETPLVIGTFYYRLKGTPGDAGLLRFCNDELLRPPMYCMRNNFYLGDSHLTLSGADGTLAVIDGPVTRPDRPPEPPRAKVYPELPSPEEINFRVEILGAWASPGSKEVPVEVRVSADVEYSSILIPVDFDERYLRLARAEHHFLGGTVLADNWNVRPDAGTDEGFAVIFSSLGVSWRRLAEEGQKIHAATLYFDVLDAASAISSTRLSVVPVTNQPGVIFEPWIGVHHEGGSGSTDQVRSEVDPIVIANGLLRIVGDMSSFIRGDANWDRKVDVSDALTTFGYLFQGKERPPCLDAADVNDDGRLDISDPAATLNFLFLGTYVMPQPFPVAGEDLTSDSLGCGEGG